MNRGTFLGFALLGLVGCGVGTNGNAANQSQARRPEGARGAEPIRAADLSARGLDFLGGSVTGLTPPSTTPQGGIAEGTPLVGLVYYGRKAGPGRSEDKQYSCDVPRDLQTRVDATSEVERAGWMCRRVNG